ncbi:MAG: hypothetical protein NWE92_11185 [Candidatus Bathyarchaeota archaeon]|nr:hypothetical protein [Candidatus Bathyarchaeota archaeon]
MEVRGDFRLIDNQEYQAQLIKEALTKANPEEKRQYDKILQRKAEQTQRMQEIGIAQEALNEKDKNNVLPEKPSADPQVWSKLSKTVQEAKNKLYREELKTYNTQNTDILNERIKLINKFLETKSALDTLEEKEKWLLLTMAIRNQPNLLNFIQSEKNEK